MHFTGEIQPNPRWMDSYAHLRPVFDHAYENSHIYWTMLETAEAATGSAAQQNA